MTASNLQKGPSTMFKMRGTADNSLKLQLRDVAGELTICRTKWPTLDWALLRGVAGKDYDNTVLNESSPAK